MTEDKVKENKRMNEGQMVKIVIIICVAIVLWAAAVVFGYQMGNAAGWQDGIGNADKYITIKEMKAYENGRQNGMFIAKATKVEGGG